MNAVVDFPTLTTLNAYKQIELEFDRELGTFFSWMKPAPRPCFTPTLLEEIQRSEQLLELHQGYFNESGSPQRVNFAVFGSRVPGVFNLGGDLGILSQAIVHNDRKLLSYYAHLCVDNQYRRATGFGAAVTTIALLEGKALGGGFEAALACDVIVAERSTTLSFPEVLFNLFPGMGALSFLSRKVGLKKAEDIIASGQVFTAKEMQDLNVIDEVVEDGLGLAATRHIIATRQRRQNTHRAIMRAKQFVQPIQLAELKSVVDVWVDAAMQLEARDLRMMARLVKAQDKLMSVSPDEAVIDALYEKHELLAVSNG